MYESSGGFANFWHYNKFKIFLTAILFFAIAFTLSQCSWGKSADMAVLHVSEVPVVDGYEFSKRIAADASLTIKNEEARIDFTAVYMPTDKEEMVASRAPEQLQVELVGGSSSLYIMDGETLYTYMGDDLFCDVSSWSDKYGFDKDECYLDQNGTVIAIPVTDNGYLTRCGLECKDLYITVRNHRESEKEKYENAFKAMEYILANK